MKVLANDGLHKNGIAILKEAGIEVDLENKSPEELIGCIGDYDAVVIRSATKLKDEKIIKAGAAPNGRLKIIGRSGVGYGNVATDIAALNGIVVKNAPFGNSTSTAELALGLMISTARNIAEAHRQLNSGIWYKKKFMGSELKDKTLLIVGCGRIGQELALWTEGRMNVIGYDKNIEQAKTRFPTSKINYYESFDEALAAADFISFHIDGDIEVVGKNELAKMKKTAILINTSRGGVINQDALYKALTHGVIAGAGLDVFTDEPKEGELFDKKFKKLSNVTLTSHIGASTEEAQTKTSEEMARVIRDYLLGGSFTNAVNMENGEDERSVKTDLHLIFVCYEDVPGAFSKITSVPGKHNLNIKSMPTRKFMPTNDGTERAMAILRFEEKPSDEIVEAINKIKKVHWAKR